MATKTSKIIRKGLADIVIDSDIPPPIQNNWHDTLLKMKVGDSFVMSSLKKDKTIRSCVCIAANRIGIKMSIKKIERAVEADSKGKLPAKPAKYRIWRIE